MSAVGYPDRASDAVARPDLRTILQVDRITKRFPGIVAVRDVSLAIEGGRVTALVGHNGAGKSTLMRVIAGVYPAGTFSGSMSLSDRRYTPVGVADAEHHGVVMVPQEITVVPERTVTQNMYLNNEPRRRGLVDWTKARADAAEILSKAEIDVHPDVRMGQLDLATQQLISIARALSHNAQVLILDEPTAALTEVEVDRLFDKIRQLKRRGVAILLVSHRLAEVLAISDRVCVMRDGELHGDHVAAATTRDEIITEMIGRSLAPIHTGARPVTDQLALVVEDLTVQDPMRPGRPAAESVSLTLHWGEVLGLFGLTGSGCSPVAQAVFGSWRGNSSGTITVDGVQRVIRRPEDAMRARIGLVAADRRASLAMGLSVAENVALASLARLTRRGLLDVAARDSLVESYREKLSIRTTSRNARVSSLSGGNQQKVQVARWLAAGSKILLMDDPCRGVDVGTRSEIQLLVRGLAQQGYAILYISSEAAELIELCDRIAVMRSGRMSGVLARENTDEERLLQVASGGRE